MRITDEQFGNFDVVLFDDGTLDCVIEVSHNGVSHDIRMNSEYVREFRDSDGALTQEGFDELADQAVEVYVESYLLD